MRYLRNRSLSIGVGIATVIFAIGFYFTIKYYGLDYKDTIFVQLIAKKADGLQVGDSVNIVGGYQIGYISYIEIDDNYHPVLGIMLDNTVKLPVDSVFTISSQSLISARSVINIIPGISARNLVDGSISHTSQHSVDINKLLDFAVSNAKTPQKVN